MIPEAFATGSGKSGEVFSMGHQAFSKKNNLELILHIAIPLHCQLSDIIGFGTFALL